MFNSLEKSLPIMNFASLHNRLKREKPSIGMQIAPYCELLVCCDIISARSALALGSANSLLNSSSFTEIFAKNFSKVILLAEKVMNLSEDQLLFSTVVSSLRVHLRDEEIQTIKRTVHDLDVDLSPVKNVYNLFCQLVFYICDVQCAKTFNQIFEAHFHEWVSLTERMKQIAINGNGDLPKLQNGYEAFENIKKTTKMGSISLKQKDDIPKNIENFSSENTKSGTPLIKKPERLEFKKSSPTSDSGAVSSPVDITLYPPASPLKFKPGPQNRNGDFSTFQNDEPTQTNGVITRVISSKVRSDSGRSNRAGIFGDESAEEVFSEAQLKTERVSEETNSNNDKLANGNRDPEEEGKPGTDFVERRKIFEVATEKFSRSIPPKIAAKPRNLGNHQKQKPTLPSSPPPIASPKPLAIDIKTTHGGQKLDMSKFSHIIIKPKEVAQPITAEHKTEDLYPPSSTAARLLDSEPRDSPSYGDSYRSFSNYLDVGNVSCVTGTQSSGKSSNIQRQDQDMEVYDEPDDEPETNCDMLSNEPPKNDDLYDVLPAVEESKASSKTSKSTFAIMKPKMKDKESKEKDNSKKSKKKNKSDD